MGVWDFLKKKDGSDKNNSAMSRCRYLMCSKCNAIYDKGSILSAWSTAVSLYRNAAAVIPTGSRTCKCGNVMDVADIYRGAYDLPRRLWGEVQGPVEVD